MLRLLAVVAAMTLSCVSSAQSSGLQSNKYISYDEPKQLIVRYRYLVYPDRTRRRGASTYDFIEYPNFAAVVPYAPESAASHLVSDEFDAFRSSMAIDASQLVSYAQPTVVRSPESPAPYILHDFTGPLALRAAGAIVVARVTTYDIEFDEAAAKNIPWPEAWPANLTGWLKHDPVHDAPPDEGGDPVEDLLKKWTGGNDPKQIPPVQLAKYLTGCVLSHVRVRGPEMFSAAGYTDALTMTDAPDSSTVYRDIQYRRSTQAIGGFNVQNAAEIALKKTGSEHDLSTLLVAVLRRAGVPARVVIGVDNEESSTTKKCKSWVEFAVVAPDVAKPFWVPIDVRELKSDGRGVNNWQQPWKHFGTSEMLRHTPPIAYHFHPPADYLSYNHPSLGGIRSSGELPGYGTEALVFEVTSAPNSTGSYDPWPNR